MPGKLIDLAPSLFHSKGQLRADGIMTKRARREGKRVKKTLEIMQANELFCDQLVQNDILKT